MRPVSTITIFSVDKRSGEETPTRLRRTRSTKKIIMVIFSKRSGILLSEYLPGKTTISGSSYASIIEQFRCVIVEKRGGKVVLLVDDNASVHKNNIVQTALEKGGFVELNHPPYSPDIALYDSYLLSNLNKFVRDKNLSSDDETIGTVKEYLNKFDWEFFL